MMGSSPAARGMGYVWKEQEEEDASSSGGASSSTIVSGERIVIVDVAPLTPEEQLV